MKRPFKFTSLLQPLYVAVASVIGINVAYFLLMQSWTTPFWLRETNGKHLVRMFAPNFLAFVFVVAVLLAFLAVVFLPLWKQLIDLIRENMSGQDPVNRRGIVIMMFLGGISFLLILQAFLTIAGSIRVLPAELSPAGLDNRVGFLIISIIVTVFPIPLISLLIFAKAYEITQQIGEFEDDEKHLLEVAHELLRYRTLLQNSLLIMGVITSAVPIMTAIMRLAYIDLYTAEVIEKFWAPLYPIMYGLGFTTVLIVFYVPTHLMLTQAGQKLRDALCPIHELDDLERSLKRRKELDDWLQINLSLAQNLRAGIVTLAPLVTSFVSSILGVKL